METKSANSDGNGLNRKIEFTTLKEPFNLDNGSVLTKVSVAYETYGALNDQKSNVILVCHALTGSAHVAGPAVFPEEAVTQAPLLASINGKGKGWWDGIIGPGKLLDTRRYFIVSTNVLGSCYGTSGPFSINPGTGKRYGPDFPQITVRDMVRVQYALMRQMNIDQILMVIGGSLGGMQVLEWGILYPESVQKLVPIATPARHTDWGIALNHLARMAIRNDPHWQGGYYDEQPLSGLSLARKIGMISYRTDVSFNNRFRYESIQPTDQKWSQTNQYQVESYLNYQGQKLVNRFDANSYLYLTRAMDTHDVSGGRGTLRDALSAIKAPTLTIGIDTDVLYPVHEQKAIAAAIHRGRYAEIRSMNGHDAFLIEFDQLTAIVQPFLQSGHEHRTKADGR
ncbi:MAG: homoserine O-acetyltransferase [Caldithrix sp.]|nr:homoserine O-acetyltransferase [Caldithrix sp.]